MSTQPRTLGQVSLTPINATIDSIRVTLRELNLLPNSEHLERLKKILHSRIAELEQIIKSTNDHASQTLVEGHED
jgi:hypothetical protein